MRILSISVSMLVLIHSGCKTTPAPQKNEASQVKAEEEVKIAPRQSSTAPSMCAAVRGNGQRITAHFPSLARIVEHYGVLDAVAGGSSGSITAFIYESIMMNPVLKHCDNGSCSQSEVSARVALLLKSVQSYIESLMSLNEKLAVLQNQSLWELVQKEKIDVLINDKKYEEAREKLLRLLSTEEIRDVINKEIIGLLKNPTHQGFFVGEVFESIKNFGKFSTEDSKILFRPGLLDFNGVAAKIGRIGSFYAGYAPSDNDGMNKFLESCSASSRGKTWSEIAAIKTGTTTCGAMFSSLVGGFRTRLQADESKYKTRVDDVVGQKIPSLISTSVLTGATAENFLKAYQEYLDKHQYSFQANFDDVKFGYWGYPSDLEKIATNPKGFKDLKTSKFMSLGPATWRYVLSYSPAEPGLARAMSMGKHVSAGGWSDLHPVQVLKNLGCDKIVYITRQGEDSSFAQGTAKLLGMSEAEQKALYSLMTGPNTEKASGFVTALTNADAVWCTNWDQGSAYDIPNMADSAYKAPLVTRHPFFLTGQPYRNILRSANLKGCSL